MLDVHVKYFDKDIEKISKLEQGDWIDLRCADDVYLKKGDFKCLPLGIGMILPEGYEAHILPRSSTFKKWGIIQTNSMGIIDNSYSGEEDQWQMPVYATKDVVIHKGDRICQFRIVKKMTELNIKEVEHLNNKSRGGFGSTGTN